MTRFVGEGEAGRMAIAHFGVVRQERGIDIRSRSVVMSSEGLEEGEEGRTEQVSLKSPREVV